MLILIAEAKTMEPTEKTVSPEEYAAHTPLLESSADYLMKQFVGMSVGEIAALAGLTTSLAAKLFRFAYEFPDKTHGYPAIEAYTGIVFKALDFPTLPEEAADLCQSRVRIISSLYGYLHPCDIVKPYRLDYTSKVPTQEGKEATVTTFWKKDVSIQLVKELKNGHHNEVLNLLPSDAAKCIDWKLVKNFCKVWTVEFTDALTGKTPQAGKLKQMRGLLLRQLLQENVSDCNSITHLASDSYVCDGTPRYPDRLHFLC